MGDGTVGTFRISSGADISAEHDKAVAEVVGFGGVADFAQLKLNLMGVF